MTEVLSAREINALNYDDRAAEWVAAMSKNFGHQFIEKPAMKLNLPETLVGKRVLCIGVGAGEELDTLTELNPEGIDGVDISEKMLEYARKKYPRGRFVNMDMHDLRNWPDKYDLIYSSLAFHYSGDWDLLLHGVRSVIKPAGTLLFSTHNPQYWALKAPTGRFSVNSRGIKLNEHQAELPGGVKIVFYNHPNDASIMDALHHSGFEIKVFDKPELISVPEEMFDTDAEVQAYQKLKTTNSGTPLFLVVKAMAV